MVIKVEGLSKQYRLGVIGTGTLSHDLNRWWAKFRGKEDPYIRLGDPGMEQDGGLSNYVWALKDINFEVKQGEVLGIIGKNGAGKSTLLKILSRVTGPTTGALKIKGRIASLLEVGTGFHPELTGKENIFLNGAILGMSKREINSKLDEIIAFSGVDRYIDTPVKRYSSGMYVRLAFAVAAHMEPEILIIDEVLAVGDAEFQKKCLGKMKDVAGQGRTVLFVSHNMQSVRHLCTRGILMNNGQLELDGTVQEAISRYTESGKDFSLTNKDGIVYNDSRRTTNHVRFTSIYLVNEKGEKTYEFKMGERIRFNFEFEILEELKGMSINVHLRFLTSNEPITTIRHIITENTLTKGCKGEFAVEMPNNTFRPGEYPLYFNIGEAVPNIHKEDVIDDLTPRLIITLNDEITVRDFNPLTPKGSVNVDSLTTDINIINKSYAE